MIHIVMLLSCVLNVLAAPLQHSRQHPPQNNIVWSTLKPKPRERDIYLQSTHERLRVIKVGAEDGHNTPNNGGGQPSGFDPGVPQYPQYPGNQYPHTGPQYPPTGPQYPPTSPQYPPTSPQYPPTSPQYPDNAMSSSDFVAILPKLLNGGDQLTIRGKASENASNFTLSLADGSYSVDDSQTPFQMHVDLTSQNVTLAIIKNGQHTVVSNESHGELTPGAFWDFRLKIDKDGSSIHIDINGSYHDSLALEHGLHQIRFLKVTGHIDSVKSLGFEFA